jgi:hemerythrin
MPLMTWNASYSVGVVQFDHEHQRLFFLINELGDAMRQGRSKEVIEKTLKGLAEYTRTHFANEERMFDRYGYPEAVSHKAQHAEFIRRVAEFQDKLAKGSVTLGVDVMGFLTQWLVKHIQGSDQKYGAFFSAKGVARLAGVPA